MLPSPARDNRTSAELEALDDTGKYNTGHGAGISVQLGLDIARVEALEGAIARLLEQDQDRHVLTWTQPGRAVALALSRGELFTLPPRRKLLPECIHRAEQVE